MNYLPLLLYMENKNVNIINKKHLIHAFSIMHLNWNKNNANTRKMEHNI